VRHECLFLNASAGCGGVFFMLLPFFLKFQTHYAPFLISKAMQQRLMLMPFLNFFEDFSKILRKAVFWGGRGVFAWTG